MKRRTIAAWTCGAVSALVLLGSFGPAYAEENETFGVTPFPERVDGLDRRTFAIPLEPGATFDDALRVYNRTDQSLELAIYAADAKASLNSDISVGFRGSKPEGVGSWIELPRDSVSLPPRGETIVRFSVTVQNDNPMPELGAIVVENTARGLRADLTQRLKVVMRTSPAASPTTSKRVRPFFLRSPWVIVAILGLIACAALIVLGWRRARRPQDAVLVAGDLPRLEEEPVPAASRPRLHRLGRREKEEPRSSGVVATLDDDRTRVIKAPEEKDERPLLDEVAARNEHDEELASSILFVEDEEPEPPAVERPPPPRPPPSESRPSEPAPKKSSKDLGYIPLDDL